MFDDPGSSTGIEWGTLLGALLLVEPHAFETGINTTLGPKDAVRADLSVIDGPKAGEVFRDTLVFPRVLASQLKSRIGGKVLGRLGQGVAKPGQNAPWQLTPATEADIASATAFVQYRDQQATRVAAAAVPAAAQPAAAPAAPVAQPVAPNPPAQQAAQPAAPAQQAADLPPWMQKA